MTSILHSCTVNKTTLAEKRSTLKGQNLLLFYSKRTEFSPLRSKFFPFRVDPFSEEIKSNFDRVTSSEFTSNIMCTVRITF